MCSQRNESFSVRPARKEDGPAILALMPRLADFDVPANRNPLHLWQDDAKLLQRWQEDQEACLVLVAAGESGDLLGFSLLRLRPELLSHAPSAHLEAIAVAKEAEGRGVARALLEAAEQSAIDQGAESMTLHVFTANRRARAFYDKAGYDGELMRYIKHIKPAGQ